MLAPCAIIGTTERQAMQRLLFFRCFYSTLALSILSPTISSAQRYRGWEYIGNTADGDSHYARLVLRSGDLIDIESTISGIQSTATLRFDCAAWKIFNPRKKQWDQVFPKSIGDSALKNSVNQFNNRQALTPILSTFSLTTGLFPNIHLASLLVSVAPVDWASFNARRRSSRSPPGALSSGSLGLVAISSEQSRPKEMIA